MSVFGHPIDNCLIIFDGQKWRFKKQVERIFHFISHGLSILSSVVMREVVAGMRDYTAGKLLDGG